MYLMVCTRPDLSFTVDILSRFVNKNNEITWKYLRGVLRYLKGTLNLKLVYKRNNNQDSEFLTAYVLIRQETKLLEEVLLGTCLNCLKIVRLLGGQKDSTQLLTHPLLQSIWHCMRQ